MTLRSSFCITSRDGYFVFLAATVENPVSHKYVVTEGSKTFTDLSGKLK
jgi:hypothetical protein